MIYPVSFEPDFVSSKFGQAYPDGGGEDWKNSVFEDVHHAVPFLGVELLFFIISIAAEYPKTHPFSEIFPTRRERINR